MNRIPVYLLPAVICLFLIFGLMAVSVNNLTQELNNQITFNKDCSDYCQKLTDRVIAAESKMSEIQNRMFLLGVLHNDNFAGVARGKKDFIYINKSWTISEMPRYTQLTPHDREVLQKMLQLSAIEITKAQENPNLSRNLEEFVKQDNKPRSVLFSRIKTFFGRFRAS